jgi:hypothetical protein
MALCTMCCLSAVILLYILLSHFYHVVDLHKLMIAFLREVTSEVTLLRNLVPFF